MNYSKRSLAHRSTITTRQIVSLQISLEANAQLFQRVELNYILKIDL